jgi:hypothetical protein
VLHRREIGDRSAYPDEGVRGGPPVEAPEVGRDRGGRAFEDLRGDDLIEPVALGEPRRPTSTLNRSSTRCP